MKTKKLAISSIFLLGCFGLPAAENLIPNPGFTVASGSDLPAEWKISSGAPARVVVLHGDQPALQITGQDSKKHYWIVGIPGIKAGIRYRLNVDVEGKNGTKGRIYVESAKPTRTFMTPPIVCNGERTQVTREIKFEKLDSVPYLVLRQDSPGEITFSKVTLEEITAPLLKNPQFNGLDGWQARNNAVVKIQKIDGKGNGVLLSANGKANPFLIQGGLPLQAQTDYEFQIEFKGEPGTLVQAYVESMKPLRTILSPRTQCTGSWQKINMKIRFSTLESAPHLVLRMMGTNGIVIFINPRMQAMEARR